MFKPLVLAAAILAVVPVSSSLAAVNATEAARLGTSLTPLGAEKAGNADGSIPAWNGGFTTPIAGDAAGGRRADPYANEKPLYSVTAANMAQYADVLTEGTRAMLERYPDSFRIDVYPTHRTAAAPQWVYDNTKANATRARMEGDKVTGAFGGIPFPIPQNGAEVMQNHVLRWRGTSWQMPLTQYQLTNSGDQVLATDGVADQQMPYYFEDSSLEEFEKSGGEYWMVRMINQGPPIRAGEAVVGRESLDTSSRAWVYLTGQRRVRKLPNPCCDTPTPSTAGVMFFDEIETFNGRLSRFDWKLVGKQEMLIPYNNNRLLQPKTDAEVLDKHHLNPDFMRWERHRVWVVEATLRNGERHQSPRGRYYCDEDTWGCVLADRWDAKGALWRTIWSQPFVAPEFPGTILGAFGMNDLLSGSAFVANLYNSKAEQYPQVPRYPDRVFTPAALAGEGVR